MVNGGGFHGAQHVGLRSIEAHSQIDDSTLKYSDVKSLGRPTRLLEHPFLYLSASAADFPRKIAHFGTKLRKSG